MEFTRRHFTLEIDSRSRIPTSRHLSIHGLLDYTYKQVCLSSFHTDMFLSIIGRIPHFTFRLAAVIVPQNIRQLSLQVLTQLVDNSNKRLVPFKLISQNQSLSGKNVISDPEPQTLLFQILIMPSKLSALITTICTRTHANPTERHTPPVNAGNAPLEYQTSAPSTAAARLLNTPGLDPPSNDLSY